MEEFTTLIKHGAVECRKEELCVRFDVLQDPKNVHAFWLYEVYKGEAGFAAHRETPHFKEFWAFKEAGAFAKEATINAGLKSVDF